MIKKLENLISQNFEKESRVLFFDKVFSEDQLRKHTLDNVPIKKAYG